MCCGYTLKCLGQEGLSSKWIMEELDDDYLKQYWKQLWATKIVEKIKALLWLCSLKSLLISVWLQKRGVDGKCRLCSSRIVSRTLLMGIAHMYKKFGLK